MFDLEYIKKCNEKELLELLELLDWEYSFNVYSAKEYHKYFQRILYYLRKK
jgi:hypothetical protein